MYQVKVDHDQFQVPHGCMISLIGFFNDTSPARYFYIYKKKHPFDHEGNSTVTTVAFEGMLPHRRKYGFDGFPFIGK